MTNFDRSPKPTPEQVRESLQAKLENLLSAILDNRIITFFLMNIDDPGHEYGIAEEYKEELRNWLLDEAENILPRLSDFFEDKKLLAEIIQKYRPKKNNQ